MTYEEKLKAVNKFISDNNLRDCVLSDEKMSRHTTFRIGGDADFFADSPGFDRLCLIVKYCKEIEFPFHIIGNGSNLLVSDKGIRGFVISIGKGMDEVEIADGNDDVIMAKSGVSLAILSKFAADHCLSGLEFASGIPGTLGGALMMNAGAYGGEMKQVVLSVSAFDKNGDLFTLEGDELGFGYRTSAFQNKECIIYSAKIKLRKAESKNDILNKMWELGKKRREKQPLDLPSAGSAFKRPAPIVSEDGTLTERYAAKIIDDCGLRGYRRGGAAVSEKHCGFIVNVGDATCDDVLSLISHVRNEVLKQTDILLEPEIKFLGEGISC